MPAARLALYQKGIEYVAPNLNPSIFPPHPTIQPTQKLSRIYIAPNADDLPSWIATMQHIAKEGRCFVINSNQYCKVCIKHFAPLPSLPTYLHYLSHAPPANLSLTPISLNNPQQVSDFPSDYPPFAAINPSDRKPDGTAWTADDVLSHGGSCIVGPLGQFVAEPVWDEEGIVYAELRMDELTEAKME